jgi:cytochrome c556
MKRLFFAFSAFALLASAAAVTAQEDVIKARQDFMKENGRLLYGQILPVVKGEKPFDAGEATATLQALNEQFQTLDVVALFPEGTSEGDTAADPAIWENFADFQAKADQVKVETAAAATANPQNVDALKTVFDAVNARCGACHEDYRQPED